MSAALKDDQATELAQYMSALGHAARKAAGELAYAEPQQKNQALLAIAEVLDQRREFILQENIRDLDAAAKEGLAAATAAPHLTRTPVRCRTGDTLVHLAH
jgi:glutamate-5-semialdehyde dehydrogenase